MTDTTNATDTTDTKGHTDKDAPSSPTEDQIAPYEPEQRGQLPRLEAPDLAPDATGLSAEALSQVPTLTESVTQDVAAATPETPPAQANAVQAESWLQTCEARINVLTQDIRQLHERLDKLENRTKV